MQSYLYNDDPSYSDDECYDDTYPSYDEENEDMM